tara:strand:+ start:1301 stop:1459 length:159 start_codon:yes stop_codon:yes gene_type:complete
MVTIKFLQKSDIEWKKGDLRENFINNPSFLRLALASQLSKSRISFWLQDKDF